MKKIIIILFLLLLCSCTTEETNEDVATTCPPGCYGGSSSVVTTISSPREEIYVGTRMPVSINLEDAGESSVEEGMVCITGLNEYVFSDLIGCNCETFYITIDDSDSSNYLETQIDFANSPYVKEGSGKQEQMTVITKYSYTTYGLFDVCLTGDPYQETECSVEGNKATTSSSGPLEVKSVEEVISPLGNTIDLRLNVEITKNEKSNEQLISTDDVTSASCVSFEEPLVSVSAVLFNEAYDCGYLKFDEDEDTAEITCTLDGISNEYFIDKKEYEGWVRLDYGYQQINSKIIEVVGE